MAVAAASVESEAVVLGSGKLMVWSLGGDWGKNVSASSYMAFAAAIQMVGSRTLVPYQSKRAVLLVLVTITHGNPAVSSSGASGIVFVNGTIP